MIGDGGLHPQDRTFLGGQSRSGKSELINVLLSLLHGQWVLIDTKPEFTIPGIEPARAPGELDFRERILHYVASPTGGPEEIDEVYERCWKAPGSRTVGIHELGDACDFRAQRAGKWVNAYLSKGGGHGKGHIGGSQRPVDIPVRALSEAQHVFYVTPRLVRNDDHRAMAEPMAIDAGALERELQHAQNEHGRYSFLWWDSIAQRLTGWPPLPEQLRARNIVGRTVDYA